MRRPLSLAGEMPLYDGDIQRDMLRLAKKEWQTRSQEGLSITEKMPCPSWGLSAYRCRVGSVLAEQENSTCASCYARKGRYLFGNVQDRLEKRYRGLFNPDWTPAMAFLVLHHCDRYFRLFDSGDLQGVNHLKNIVQLAEAVPDVKIWLPTREVETVRASMREVLIPDNLVIRVSGAMVNGPAPSFPFTSVVTDGKTPKGHFKCPSRDQGNRCRDCRACWSEPKVSYRLH